MSETRHWHDLMPRVVSGVAMAAAGIAVVWLGGWVFTLAAVAVCGAMIWEASRMFAAPAPHQDGMVGALAVLLASVLPGLFAAPLVLGSGLASAGRVPRDRSLCLAFHVWIVAACLALVVLRGQLGAVWLLWLVGVVVASDVAGYFAGRALGGPKFWPRVSPKKTWSGTIAGWIGAGLIGWGFMAATGSGVELIGISVALSMASQMGDIAESAVKRRMGVKDSSNLLPGHGGVYDRFDGLLGAAFLLVIVESLTAFPPPPV